MPTDLIAPRVLFLRPKEIYVTLILGRKYGTLWIGLWLYIMARLASVFKRGGGFSPLSLWLDLRPNLLLAKRDDGCVFGWRPQEIRFIHVNRIWQRNRPRPDSKK